MYKSILIVDLISSILKINLLNLIKISTNLEVDIFIYIYVYFFCNLLGTVGTFIFPDFIFSLASSTFFNTASERLGFFSGIPTPSLAIL